MEILVVVSNIATLVALLVPAIALMRDQAAFVSCMSNLRQYGSANEGFAFEHDGVLPNSKILHEELALYRDLKSRFTTWPNRVNFDVWNPLGPIIAASIDNPTRKILVGDAYGIAIWKANNDPTPISASTSVTRARLTSCSPTSMSDVSIALARVPASTPAVRRKMR